MFLDCDAIDDRFVDVRTLFASSLKEILRGLLLRHRRQRMKQSRRGEKREHEIAKERETQRESAQVL